MSRPIGPASEVLNILDERVREALHRGGALEIDGLILAAPQAPTSGATHSSHGGRVSGRRTTGFRSNWRWTRAKVA
ncbi:hypothetical protein G7085_00345 [Tessaracoccus sp. HDW20]|uniref:hypothetical protein n=1 Tax=Tessaracoccus coleopterorum TaxID=2714950 RepID=UPI0018D4A148|nr:hypothetical protein [Tessaracoccus coleopterorum]NHB83668.1 hypothetical protein [Tessaracoccus coleopterorum]